jgi:hypothetical protein
VTFWCGSGSADLYRYLLLTDLDSAPDPTPFFSEFKDTRKYFFSPYFFLQLTRRHIIFSLKNLFFLLKFCVEIIFCKHYRSPLNTFMRKGKDPDGDGETGIFFILNVNYSSLCPDVCSVLFFLY